MVYEYRTLGAPLEINPEYIELFTEQNELLYPTPFYGQTMELAKDDLMGKITHILSFQTAQILTCMHTEIDSDIYRQDTLMNAEAIVNTVMTRSRAQAAINNGQGIRKEELKISQDLPVNQKHIMAPGLFRQDGTIIEDEALTDTEILYDDNTDMQGLPQDDISQHDIAS